LISPSIFEIGPLIAPGKEDAYPIDVYAVPGMIPD
jgi:hypothetical protein